MKLTIGILLIVAALTVMFFGPVIHRWYLAYFGFDEKDYAGVIVSIFLMLIVIGLGGSGISVTVDSIEDKINRS